MDRTSAKRMSAAAIQLVRGNFPMPVFAAFRRFSSIAVLLMITGSISTFAQCNGTISLLIDGEQSDRFSRIAELHAKGEASILSLLEAMSDSHIVDLDLTNPRSSQISEQPTYCGLVAAFFIELILAREHLHLEQGEDFSLLGWDHDDYPYWIGEVVTDDGKPIKASNIPEIASHYRAWWESHKNLSLSELRIAWSKGERPLSKTGYRWR